MPYSPSQPNYTFREITTEMLNNKATPTQNLAQYIEDATNTTDTPLALTKNNTFPVYKSLSNFMQGSHPTHLFGIFPNDSETLTPIAIAKVRIQNNKAAMTRAMAQLAPNAAHEERQKLFSAHRDKKVIEITHIIDISKQHPHASEHHHSHEDMVHIANTSFDDYFRTHLPSSHAVKSHYHAEKMAATTRNNTASPPNHTQDSGNTAPHAIFRQL
jgi:hypothetical protein